MILVKIQDGDTPRWGIREDNVIHLLDGTPYASIQKTGETRDAVTAHYLAPCDPSILVAVGRNYAEHIAELDSPMPDDPTIFFKPLTSLNHPGGTIVMPPHQLSHRVDYEGELAFVVKKEARNVAAEDAAEYILGYTCLNDVTARDLQRKDGQWARAKGFDTFGPVGPYLTDEIDPSSCGIRTRVNGKTVQESNTSMMLWDVPALFAFITQFMTLKPGDIVTTGTPEGVGPLHPGDTVEVEVDGIGVLRNTVVADPEDA